MNWYLRNSNTTGVAAVTFYSFETARWTSPTGDFVFGTDKDFPLVWR